tara:strand:- start:7656 stop:8498 length:843 start_codon:yes stop_codon:yes gene_type:complete
MTIGRFLNSLLFCSVLALLNSCTSIPQVKDSFKWPVDSFVKYETYTYKQSCTPRDPDNLKSPCYDRITGATGSASIIAKSFNGAYILTAAHMCDRASVIQKFKSIDKELGNGEYKYFQKHSVYDIDQFKYNVEVIAWDWELDSCIVFAWGLFGPSLEIAEKGPEIGEKIYNFAAPAGFFKKDLVPLFDGYFIGFWNKYTAVYTIPVIGGSSGSPIINNKAELIGVVYARHSSFHHIAISPKFKNLKKFIADAIRADTKKKAREHELDERRSVIIKFNEKQ